MVSFRNVDGDVGSYRHEFPILQQTINGKPLVFLDSGASSQKPQRVLDCLETYYSRYNANVHRGVYTLSEEASWAYEQARNKVARFIGAATPREIIFTRNTTEAINLVAYAWGCANLRPGDRILLTVMEHHSNIVPWQLLAQRVGAHLDYLLIDEIGQLDLTLLDRMVTSRTRIVSFTHQSNVLGTINPVQTITRAAHAMGALVLLDAAQSVPHMPLNVQDLDIDFLAFSGHKMCGPTGIGVLWGRYNLLDAMPPFLGGGSMISEVYLDTSAYTEVPARFEAGTPAIGEAIALGEAVDFLTEVGRENITRHEHVLLSCAYERLRQMEGVVLHGPPVSEQHGAALAFTVHGIHPHDIASILDEEGIAVRAGRHCAHPLHRFLGVPATARASFYLYNTLEDVDRLVAGLEKVQQVVHERGPVELPPPEPCRNLSVFSPTNREKKTTFVVGKLERV